MYIQYGHLTELSTFKLHCRFMLKEFLYGRLCSYKIEYFKTLLSENNTFVEKGVYISQGKVSDNVLFW